MDYMCQYGDCPETDTPFVLSISFEGARRENCRFCSTEHMCQWMLDYAKRRVRSHETLPSL